MGYTLEQISTDITKSIIGSPEDCGFICPIGGINKFLWLEMAPEYNGGGGVYKLDPVTGSKTTVVESSNYNRTFLHPTIVNYSDGIHIFTGYGEAYDGALDGNKGDLWEILQDGTINRRVMPYLNTEANIHTVIYDVQKDVLFAGGHAAGKRLYKLTKNGVYNDDWIVGNNYVECHLVVVDDTNLMLQCAKSGVTDVYFMPFATLRNHWKEQTYVYQASTFKDSVSYEYDARKIASSHGKLYGLQFNSTTPKFDYTDSNGDIATIGTFSSSRTYYGVFYQKHIFYNPSTNKIEIYPLNDISTAEATLDCPSGFICKCHGYTLPFLTVYDDTNTRFRIYAIAKDGKVPILQYDPNTVGKVRVIDYLTGNSISAVIEKYELTTASPQMLKPLATPTTETISDYTTISPSTGKTINVFVRDV